MSRIGKKIRTIPAGVTVNVTAGEVSVKGPKGELKQKLHPRISIVVKDGAVSVETGGADKQARALWGTFSALIGNMLKGVTEGFSKQMEISGVGYKAAMKGEDLALEVGFSHPVEIKPEKGIKFRVEKNIITVEGADKQAVGEMAARVRAVRKPEPYKGKGIRYVGEIVRRKAGKTAAKGTAAA
ncbi:50S ribosomal protein L6 [Patescibacteria group bacterium]|nr:MAG: 50S ribosomal protein L6 [Patescibacteria group bacterium]